MPGEMFSCEGFDCGACLGSTSLGASEQNVRRRAPPCVMRSVTHRLAPGGKTLCRGLWSADLRPHHARLLKKIISF